MGSARNGAPTSTPTSAPLSLLAASPAAPHSPPSATLSQLPRPSEPRPDQVDSPVDRRFERQDFRRASFMHFLRIEHLQVLDALLQSVNTPALLSEDGVRGRGRKASHG